jgi:2-polyprenyl-3-methyl-5-hydroxy-6-metoxy-1,4-benzoquinol methylase
MMTDRISVIREEERKYHEDVYNNYNLFEAGTWLHKPVKTVMETLNYFSAYDYLEVLDLGCGIGRNSIPIAETMKERSGKIVCVDLLQTALDKLEMNSNQYNVSKYIDPHLSDIADFNIITNQYDYIVAVSALEHVESEAKLKRVLANMIAGTRVKGINCIIMNTNIEEIDEVTGDKLDPYIELNMTTQNLVNLFEEAYKEWKVTYTTVKPLEFNIERSGNRIVLKGDCLTYVVQRCV